MELMGTRSILTCDIFYLFQIGSESNVTENVLRPIEWRCSTLKNGPNGPYSLVNTCNGSKWTFLVIKTKNKIYWH